MTSYDFTLRVDRTGYLSEAKIDAAGGMTDEERVTRSWCGVGWSRWLPGERVGVPDVACAFSG